jgi:hypothetical protein
VVTVALRLANTCVILSVLGIGNGSKVTLHSCTLVGELADRLKGLQGCLDPLHSQQVQLQNDRDIVAEPQTEQAADLNSTPCGAGASFAMTLSHIKAWP